jgi:hypothetical protein
VNDYTQLESNHENFSKAGRDLLQSITIELHSVSQTTDSGMANADMSIRLTEFMYARFREHCCATPPAHPQAGEAIRVTNQAIFYALNSWYSQSNWLRHYKARKDTAMGFVSSTRLSLSADQSIQLQKADLSRL